MNPAFPSQLHKALLIGTGAAAAAPDAQLAPALRELGADASVEQRLWEAIAAHDLWQRAGAVAPKGSALPVDVPAPETLRACPTACQRILGRLTQETQPALPREWLMLANRHGVHLPARFLPAMLALGTRQKSLRGLVAGVIGARGHWLARQNPEWTWVGAPETDSPTLWDTGNLDQRVNALHAMRADDRGAALAALQATWPSESPEARAALLACLATGIAHDDEAFLERALDDKRKEVRITAQRLLAGLPGSQLSQRMLARVGPLIRLDDAGQLVVELPAAPDKAMQRDGIGAGPLTNGLGEKAQWLVDMLSAVSPMHWSDKFGLAPAACLALSAGTDFQRALHVGWSAALLRDLESGQGCALAPWMSAMLEQFIINHEVRSVISPYLLERFDLLPAELAEEILLRIADLGSKAWRSQDAYVWGTLARAAKVTHRTWSPQLSATIVDRIREGLIVHGLESAHIARELQAFAPALDPTQLAAYETGWPTDASVCEQVDQFLRTMRFRHEMYQPFQEQPA